MLCGFGRRGDAVRLRLRLRLRAAGRSRVVAGAGGGVIAYGRIVARIPGRTGPGIPYSRSTQDKAPDRAGKKRR